MRLTKLSINKQKNILFALGLLSGALYQQAYAQESDTQADDVARNSRF